jgi:hypothetical protein
MRIPSVYIAIEKIRGKFNLAFSWNCLILVVAVKHLRFLILPLKIVLDV